MGVVNGSFKGSRTLIFNKRLDAARLTDAAVIKVVGNSTQRLKYICIILDAPLA